jgi:predicted amidohydrolase
MTPPPIRIAVCQQRMHWRGEDNTAAIIDALAQASVQGAQVCLFPELAVTGIHRQIAVVARPELVRGWLASISAACARSRIAVSVGAPSFTADGQRHIAQHFFDDAGQLVGSVHKAGLTAPEATFFDPGHQRPTLPLAGRRWSAMICREIDDADAIARQLAADPPDIVVWPGAMRPDPDRPPADPPWHVQDAQAFARRCGAFVVMVNWPNALNRPEESADAGASVVIDPQGRILLTLPQAEAGLGVFDLGAESFQWRGAVSAAAQGATPESSA